MSRRSGRVSVVEAHRLCVTDAGGAHVDEPGRMQDLRVGDCV